MHFLDFSESDSSASRGIWDCLVCVIATDPGRWGKRRMAKVTANIPN